MDKENFKEKLHSLFHRKWTFPQSNKFKEIIRSFSIAEKVIFYSLLGVFFLSSLTLLYEVNAHYLVQEPARGGTLTEGIVGSPRFINPIIATSGTDKDLVTLTYSGLLKSNPDGTLAPDLAESYTVSPDGLTYTFMLKNNAKFSDGSAITPDDVIFTITKAEDAAIKSPQASAWAGVKVTSTDAHTIVVTQSQPYGPFIYNMTLGILPKHIWGTIADDSFPFSQNNIKPIGSGPYVVNKVITDSSGLPTEYDLDANSSYISGNRYVEPYISHIVLKFYTTETSMINAYDTGNIDAMSGVSPENMPLIKRTDGATLTAPLSRVFGVFFNQSSAPVLLNPEVRQALDMALNKQKLIDTVLGGYGVPLAGPIADDIANTAPAKASILNKTGTAQPDANIEAAQLILEKAGWTLNSSGMYTKKDPKNSKNNQTLTFSLTTSDAPELKAAAEQIQQTWDAMGAKVDVKIYQIGDLNQTIIQPRNYDALLFGEIIGQGTDLYPFWDSAERNAPGLNIALYASLKADKILQQMRATADPNTVATLENQFETQIASDRPAVFLYAPDFIYIVPKDIQNVKLGTMTDGSDRWNNVSQWYIETTSVWKIFKNN